MVQAHLDASDGITGEMLLGALVDCGASIEGVEEAVRTLGVGTVKLAWARVPRGDETACSVRVRAPEQTPDLPTWSRIREVLTYAALDDGVRDRALETLRRLVAAEADGAGVQVDDLELPTIGVLDVLANVVGACAAVAELALDVITVGPVGVGRGEVDGFAGPEPATPPAVTSLLAGFTVAEHDVAARITDATGAALLATFARRGAGEAPATPARTGLGAGDRSTGADGVLRLHLAAPATA